MPPTNWNTDHDCPAPAAQREWSITECAQTLYRRKVLLLWIAGCCLLAAALASVVQRPVYQSHAAIQVQGINENFLNLRDIYPTTAPGADNAAYIQTEAEILRQDSLLERVVTKLGLDQRPEFKDRPGVWDILHGRTQWTALEELKKSVQIVPSRGSSIIQIICDSHDPKLAADLANALAQTFIDQSIDARQRSAMQTQASLSIERDALGKRLARAEAELGGYGPREKGAASYDALRRELDANRQFYQLISRRIDEARVASAVNQANVRLVSPARPADYPYKPNLPLNLALGAIGGLVLAMGYVMLREQSTSVLRAPGEAGAFLAIPELGAIPIADKPRPAALRLIAPVLKGSFLEAALAERPGADLSEPFRATLASILSAGQNGSHPHTLVVTSSRAGEGKTTVVSHLAIALAEIGNKVLVIDGDFRRPRLHKVFDQPNSWGLSDLLQEKNAIEDLPLEALVKRTALPHLHLLPSGTSAENIFALLWSGRMARLLPRFREVFDYVLIDAPPCLEFADARIIGRYAEQLLLVVRADSTDRQIAHAAVQRLLLDGITVMGVIFNGWDPSNGGTYAYSRGRQESA